MLIKRPLFSRVGQVGQVGQHVNRSISEALIAIKEKGNGPKT